MKKIFYSCLIFLAVLDSRAQDTLQFNQSSINWPTPAGGVVSGGTQLGFNGISSIGAIIGASANSQAWVLIDMNGDKKPDLVVTSAYGGTGQTEFTGGWQVHLNTGASFSNTVTTWATPAAVTGVPTEGVYYTSNVSTTASALGTQSWDMVDMNGDGLPDLVVTGEVGAQFGAGTVNQNWQVYLNTGNGFSSIATTWVTPTGGITLSGGSGTVLGFPFTSGTSAAGDENFSSSWSLVDINGDGKPDLVVTAGYTATGATEDEIGFKEQWNVYMNTGSGFAVNPTTWYTPSGGAIVGSDSLGFNAISNIATGQSAGSASWSLLDMNGDGKPDLVVTGVLGASSVSEVGANVWHVYINNGTSGFATSPITWATPNGEGYVPAGGSTAIGINGISNVGVYPAQGVNSQSWVVQDLNGDGKPDLVVTASLGTQGPTEFSPGTANWFVYLNTGSGFSSNGTYWFIPGGGETTTAGGYLGFNYTSDVASTTNGDAVGSYSWSTIDLEGNGFPDLVLEGTLASAGNTEYSATSSPYWTVYRNASAPPEDTTKDTSTIGIKNIETSFACNLYPNPNNGNFKLVFSDNIERNVDVTDVTGQTLISNLHVARQATISMPSFAQGIYFVTVRDTNGASKVMMVSVEK
jgi:hypothetical protein